MAKPDQWKIKSSKQKFYRYKAWQASFWWIKNDIESWHKRCMERNLFSGGEAMQKDRLHWHGTQRINFCAYINQRSMSQWLKMWTLTPLIYKRVQIRDPWPQMLFSARHFLERKSSKVDDRRTDFKLCGRRGIRHHQRRAKFGDRARVRRYAGLRNVRVAHSTKKNLHTALIRYCTV